MFSFKSLKTILPAAALFLCVGGPAGAQEVNNTYRVGGKTIHMGYSFHNGGFQNYYYSTNNRSGRTTGFSTGYGWTGDGRRYIEHGQASPRSSSWYRMEGRYPR